MLSLLFCILKLLFYKFNYLLIKLNIETVKCATFTVHIYRQLCVGKIEIPLGVHRIYTVIFYVEFFLSILPEAICRVEFPTLPKCIMRNTHVYDISKFK